MLVLADRNFFGFELWNEVRAAGAELAWRTKSNHSLPIDERLPDGSYLSHVQASRGRQRLKSPVVVRVVAYDLDDPAGARSATTTTG